MVQNTKEDSLFPGSDSISAEASGLGEELDLVSALDARAQEQLGKVFRAYCDDLIHQPIPDKFVVLLAKLEAKQREKK